MADKETGHDEINFESALENYLNPDFGDLEEGSITKGEIVRVDDDNVLVDVNFKSEGQIPAAEFRDPAGNDRQRGRPGGRLCGAQERNGRHHHPLL